MRTLFAFGLIWVVSLTSAQTEVASMLPFDISTGRPIMQVYINGDGPFRFVFDTAASQTIVSADLALRLRLPSTGKTLISSPGSRATISVQKRNIKELRLGEFKFFDRSVVEVADKALFQAISADGVISIQDFGGYTVSIDYQNKRLLIDKGVLSPLPSDDVVSLTYVENVPGVEIEINGKRTFCILDTGSPFSIAFPTTTLNQPGSRPNNQASTVTGKIPFSEIVFDGTIKIGSVVLKNPTIQVIRGIPYGILGTKFFMEAVVSFDLSSAKVRIVPKSQK